MKKLILLLLLLCVSVPAFAQHVPPAASVTDTAGVVWTLGAPSTVCGTPTNLCLTILMNGNPSGGFGTEIILYQGVIYAKGDDAQYYRWVGAWTFYGPTAPDATVPTVTRFLQWLQFPDPAFPDANTYVYTLYTNGGPGVVINFICLTGGTQMVCSSQLPALNPGTYTFELTASIVGEGTSPRASVTYVVTGGVIIPPVIPPTPNQLQIIELP